jgi:hypothetical protein
MRRRPVSITVAAIILVVLSLIDLPLPVWNLIPGVEEPPAFIFYLSIVVGIVGLVAAAGLWMLKRASVPAALVVAALNLLQALLGLGDEPPPPVVQAVLAVSAIMALVIVVLLMLPVSRRAFAASSA